MSETIAPTAYVALTLAFMDTGFGVFVEKHFVSRWSILFNCAGVASLALSLHPSQVLEFVAFIAYAIAGASLVASRKKGKAITAIKQLFGSKIYGSLALAYAFYAIDDSYVSTQLLSLLESAGFPKWFDSYIAIFSWMVITTFVIIASIIVYFKTKKDD